MALIVKDEISLTSPSVEEIKAWKIIKKYFKGFIVFLECDQVYLVLNADTKILGRITHMDIPESKPPFFRFSILQLDCILSKMSKSNHFVVIADSAKGIDNYLFT